MSRPRRFRRILGEPPIRCFLPETDQDIDFLSVEVTMDEFEAIRLRDYNKIQQKKAAEIMGISQPTFHRIVNSGRLKIAKALVEGKIIKITGGDYIMEKDRYKCNVCGFEWQKPQKEYKECPDCGSENIILLTADENLQTPVGQPGLGRRRGFGGGGIGAGPPRVCKCPQCGYETEKQQGIPCRNTKCPECGIPLCGSD